MDMICTHFLPVTTLLCIVDLVLIAVELLLFSAENHHDWTDPLSYETKHGQKTLACSISPQVDMHRPGLQ